MKLTQIKSKLIFLSSILIILLSATSIILSEYSFIIDLFSHFQLQYIILLGIIAIISLFYKKFIIFFISISYCILILSTLILPAEFISKQTDADIFYMNTYYYNDKNEEIIKEILQKSPEHILLVEPAKSLIQELKKQYGEPLLEINEKANSFAFFSKNKELKVNTYENSLKFISVKFPNFTLIGIHAMDPLTKTKRKQNLAYFSEINKYIESLNGENFLLVGDFNDTVFSGTFRKFFSKYFKKNYYSWNSQSPFIIPIDHAMSNFPIKASLTKKLSSDHRGLIIDLTP
jgi:endonuclease/exonuclease/phosphatase (EEP) superfamily protein YafD